MIPELQNLANDDILGLTLIGEARGEPIESIVGVASVIRNRFQLKYGGQLDYPSVCLAKNQFSCWNTNDPNYNYLLRVADLINKGLSITDISLNQCFLVAQGIIDWKIKDNTKGATHYLSLNLYHSSSCPIWAKTGKVTVTLGNHIFLIAD